MRDRIETEAIDMEAALDELAAACEHHQAVQRRHHSTFVRENGRRGGSPWAELMDAIAAVLDLRHAHRNGSRPGFTLIELLVVLVIIGVLAALLLPVIGGAVNTARNSAVAADMHSISTALTSFRVKHGDLPPSRILLSESGTYGLSPTQRAAMVASANGTSGTDITMGTLADRSVQYLHTFWPRLPLTLDPTATAAPGVTATSWYDFDGDGVRATEPYILEGDEVLCWALGGVPLNTGTREAPKWSLSGWGKNPLNPFTSPQADTNRVVPLLDFKPERLVDLDDPTSDDVRFPVYLDGLGTDRPIAYFSAYGGEAYDPNDCNWGPLDSTGKAPAVERDEFGLGPITRTFRVKFATVTPSGADAKRLATSTAPNPYTFSDPQSAVVQWQKASSFQLVSAGRDGFWGAGGVWDKGSTTHLTPNPAGTFAPPPTDDPAKADVREHERDNIGSFASGVLEW